MGRFENSVSGGLSLTWTLPEQTVVFGAGALPALSFVKHVSGRMATMSGCVCANFLLVSGPHSASYCSVLVRPSLACIAADLYSHDRRGKFLFLLSESVHSKFFLDLRGL